MKKSLFASVAMLALAGGASAEDIKVGLAAGVTGPIADLVAPIVAAQQQAAQDINDQGGLYDGDTLSLVLADSACDPKAAVDAGNKLINVDQVVAIVGPVCSGATNGITQSVAIPAGVTVLSPSASAPTISTLDDNDLVYRVAASDAYQGLALAELTMKAGKTKVAVTYANDDYNAALAEVFLKEFEAMGGEVVANQAHEPDKASYRAEVTTLSGSGADTLVLFAYYGSSGVTVIRNSLETGAFNFFIGADGMVAEETVQQIGADNLVDKGFFTTAASDDSTDAFAAYEKMAAAGDFDIRSPFVPNGYDSVFLMGLAIEKAGSADRTKIAAALREVANAPGEVILPGEWSKAKALLAEGKDINYVGAAGEIEFDENGDVAGLFSLNTVQADGTWKVELLQ